MPANEPKHTSWRIMKLDPVGEWFWSKQILPEPDVEDYIEQTGESITLDGKKIPIFGAKKGMSFSEDLMKSYRTQSMKVNCCKCGLPAQLAYITPDYGKSDETLPTFWCWADWKRAYGKPHSKS